MSSSSNKPPTPKALVLVVDDEAQIRSVMARYLELLGYRVDLAASGAQALEQLRHTPYDVAVLDICMPGMDGVETMRRARQTRPDLAIVLLTGHASLESAIAAVKADAVDYLLKPVSVRDLASALAKALQQRAQVGRARMQQIAADRFLETGGVLLDRQHRVATIAETASAGQISAKLTDSETKLLAYFMQHPNRGLSCAELASAALGYDVDDREAAKIVRPHICRLRKKIEPTPSHPQVILTLPRRTYRFDPR